MRTRRSNLTTACALALLVAGAGLAGQAPAAVFTVDTADDITDATPGDGLCDTGVGSCSLRAAVMEANALAGADEIQFDPALAGTPIELTLTAETPDEGFDVTGTPPAPTASPDASAGDLDITDTLTITGLDPERIDDTLIRWAAEATPKDRIFHVEAVSADLSVTLANLAVGDGVVGEIDIPDASPETDFVLVRRGGAVTLGQGAAVVDRLTPSGPDGGGDGGDGGPPDDHDEEGFAIEAATLTRLLIFGSTASGDGGGLFNAAPLQLVESIITGNVSAANGGGLYNDAASTIRGSTIGAFAAGADVPTVVDDSLLNTGNQGENGGGLFDTGFHTTRIEASAISRNNAIGGGGIAARSLIVVELVNSTVSGNIATDVGGGITTNGTVSLLNSTVADNAASTDAPGGGAGLNSFGDGTYFFTNSIIANNNKTGDETQSLSNCGCSGGAVTCPPLVMNSDGGNLEDGESCALDEPDDLPLTDPLLLALTNVDPETGVVTASEYHPLQRDELGVSPAIDAADDTVCPNNDQRGSIRPADGSLPLDGTAVCDIGAYELFVPVSDLAITNLQLPDRADTGAVFQIVATATNGSGDTPATATSLTVTLPAGLTAAAASFTVDGGAPADCTVAGGTVTCAVGTLAAGSVAEATVEASGDVQDSYQISAAVSSEVTDDVPANNQASATIFLVGSADLDLSARANVGTVELGNQLTVTFTATNGGPDDATEVRLAGNVPAQAAFVSASADNGGTCTEQDGTVLCELGTLPVTAPTANVSVVLRAVSTGAVQAAATVEADQRDPDEANNTVATSFTFEEEDDDDDGLFGCTSNPGGRVDPLLPALLLTGLGWVGLRRRLQRA